MEGSEILDFKFAFEKYRITGEKLEYGINYWKIISRGLKIFNFEFALEKFGECSWRAQGPILGEEKSSEKNLNVKWMILGEGVV